MTKDIGKRINEVRSTLGLSMEKFGKQIGITKVSVHNIEKGNNNPSEQTIMLICKEFNVDYVWLTEGVGDDMFVSRPTSKVNEIMATYGLSEAERPLIEGYLEAPESVRRQVADYLNSIVEREIARRQKKEQDK